MRPSADWTNVKPLAGEAAILNLRGVGGWTRGRATVTISNRRTSENTVAQLSRNVMNANGHSTIFDVAGWAAVTFTREIQPDTPENSKKVRVPKAVTRVETLVAIDKTLLRISITLGFETKPGGDQGCLRFG